MEISGSELELRKGQGLGKGPGIRLTERDFDLLAFLHDQSFSSLSGLYYRFFDRRKNSTDPLPKNLWVTRQRVACLRQAGLIASQRVFSDPQALYLLTREGYQVLEARRELGLYVEPSAAIDFRYFEHDRRVNLCRIALERSGKCLKWYPDRFLRKKRAYPYGENGWVKFPQAAIPDGVFISSKGERVAIELELTPKKRERTIEKCRHYKRLFLSAGDSGPSLHRVLWIASTPRIGRDLERVLGGEPCFTLYSFESLVGGTLGREALSL